MTPSSDQPPRDAPGTAAQFVTTHWSVVLAAGQSTSPEANQALEALCRTYWYPLYAYVRRKGYDTPDAQDLTQEFFARLLARNYLSVADRNKGKFRSFLLGSLVRRCFAIDRSAALRDAGSYVWPRSVGSSPRLPSLSRSARQGENVFSFDPGSNGLKTGGLMRIITAVFLSSVFAPLVFAAGQARHIVVVVWDGMRPDFITEQYTPTLHRLARDGVFFGNHHPVYLSATEVNGTALSTGAYPSHNGIMANKEYRPRINPLKPIGTETREAVRAGDRLTTGHYLNLPTLAEILQGAGHTTAVAGTKPVALLHDRRERDDPYGPGKILYANNILPTNWWPRLVRDLGPYPNSASPNAARDAWTTRALTGVFWKEEVPTFSLLWLSEPDYSQHDTGVGSRTSLGALESSDRNLARVLDELDRRGLRAETDVLIVSDHGFSTIVKMVDIANTLQDAGFKALREFFDPPARDEILVVSNGGATLLYVIGHDSKLVRKVVGCLQKQEFTGVLFTRQPVDGAFTLEQARLNTPEAPDIVVALRWSPGKSTNGTSGLVFCDEAGRKAGEGMHVTLSRFDMRNTLIAAGPDFHRGTLDDLPSGNVDVAPTILWILGIKPPKPMDGRVLTEALTIGGPKVERPVTTQLNAMHREGKFIWRQYLKRTELNGVAYCDEGNGGSVSR